MSKTIMFNANTLDQRECDETEAKRLHEEGWMRNPRLVAMHHPGYNDDKMVLHTEVSVWANKGYYAEPTFVYHPEQGSRKVPAEEAKRLLNDGWYDSPAKFPGAADGVQVYASKKTKQAA